MNANMMKNNRILFVMLAAGLLSACSTTPAPSIYKGAQAPKPAPKLDPGAPVVRPLSSGGLQETPLEAKPLPAKPLNSYAPSAVAPSAPMTPGVDYAQVAATTQINSTTAAGVQQVNKAGSAASQRVSNATAKVDAGVSQVNQATSAGKQALSVASLPAASLSGSPAARELATSADAALGRGDLSGSAAILERALRIEPNNAGLWSRLAEVRLRQGDTAQAEQLALKANGLAGVDAALRSRNEQIVAQARGR